jgi:hypothetical protein
MHPRGFGGGGFKPVRMSQRRFAGELEYAQAMLWDGVWKKTNDAEADAGRTRASSRASRITGRR